MSYFNMVCDSCGREVFGCNIVNGMKFCAKCYQETFGNQQNKESNELLVNSLAEKDRKITELQKQLEEKEKTIQGLIEAQKYLEKSASYQMFLDIQKQLEEKDTLIEQLQAENKLLKVCAKGLDDLLKSQAKKIVEDIEKNFTEYLPLKYKTGAGFYSRLNTILKKFGGENE